MTRNVLLVADSARLVANRLAFLPGLPSDSSPGQFRVLPRNCLSGRTDHQEAHSLVQNGSKKRTKVGIFTHMELQRTPSESQSSWNRGSSQQQTFDATFVIPDLYIYIEREREREKGKEGGVLPLASFE